MGGVPDPSQPLEFGRFRIVPHRREFFVDGRAAELGGRAFDTLLILIDGRGTVLSKDELMRRIWPDRVVEENNLEVQISRCGRSSAPIGGSFAPSPGAATSSSATFVRLSNPRPRRPRRYRSATSRPPFRS